MTNFPAVTIIFALSVCFSGGALSAVVSGSVKYADSTPAVGLSVLAYDKDLSASDSLGLPATTDGNGYYTISYSEADFQFTNDEQGSADVFVRVFDDIGVQLFQSLTILNAPAMLEMNLNLNQQGGADVFVRVFDDNGGKLLQSLSFFAVPTALELNIDLNKMQAVPEPGSLVLLLVGGLGLLATVKRRRETFAIGV